MTQPQEAPQQVLSVDLSAYCHVPAAAVLHGPNEDQLLLPCGKVLKFWVAVELLYDPAAPLEEPKDLHSAELATLGVSGPEYGPGCCSLELEPAE